MIEQVLEVYRKLNAVTLRLRASISDRPANGSQTATTPASAHAAATNATAGNASAWSTSNLLSLARLPSVLCIT